LPILSPLFFPENPPSQETQKPQIVPAKFTLQAIFAISAPWLKAKKDSLSFFFRECLEIMKDIMTCNHAFSPFE
jgi:hypothetical protein